MADIIPNGINVVAETKDETLKTSIEGKGRLRKEIGLISATSLVVGNIIGSGIFVSASGSFRDAGSVGLGLLVWLGCGILAVASSLCYAELGTMLPSSGGELVYLRAAFGDVVAFVFCWASCLFIRPATVTIICLGLGKYVVGPIFYNCEVNDPNLNMIIKLVAASAIIVINIINCLSVRAAARTAVLFTSAKLIGIFTMVVVGFVNLGMGKTYNFEQFFAGTSNDSKVIAIAFYNGLWAFDGWNSLNFLAEELSNPSKDLPLSLGAGVIFCTVCYLLVNVGYLTTLTFSEIIESNAVAFTVADKLFGSASVIMPILVVLSAFGAAHGTSMTNARLVFAAARDSYMPRVLSLISVPYNTPITAITFQSVICLLMMIPDASSFDTLMQYFNFAAWTFYGLTFASLIVLRFRQPHTKRPFKVFIGLPIFMVLASVYLVVAPYILQPVESSVCLAGILAGVPVYYLTLKYPVFSPQVLDRISRFYDWVGEVLNSRIAEEGTNNETKSDCTSL